MGYLTALAARASKWPPALILAPIGEESRPSDCSEFSASDESVALLHQTATENYAGANTISVAPDLFNGTARHESYGPPVKIVWLRRLMSSR